MSVLPVSRPPRLHSPECEPESSARRRSIWRQRVIEAEGGLRVGFRADSTLHVHLFVASMIAISGVVLGLSFVEWLLMFAGFATTIAAELFHQSIQVVASEVLDPASVALRKVLRLSTAATLVVIAGSTLLALCILVRRLWLLFA